MGASATQFDSEESPIVLVDYERSAEDRSSAVALIDITTAQMRLLDLPAAYWYHPSAASRTARAWCSPATTPCR